MCEPGEKTQEWLSLSEEQRKGVLEAYEDSEDEANLIPLEVIIEKYKNWPEHTVMNIVS